MYYEKLIKRLSVLRAKAKEGHKGGIINKELLKEIIKIDRELKATDKFINDYDRENYNTGNYPKTNIWQMLKIILTPKS